MKLNYLNLAEQIVKKMTKTGLEVEVYYSAHSKLQISVEHNTIKSEREESTHGFCFRVAKGKQIGLAYSNSIDVSKLLNACQLAAQIATKSQPDKNWSGFPSQQQYKPVKDIFDEQFAHLEAEKAFEFLETTMKGVQNTSSENDVQVSLEGGLVFDIETEGIVNSQGLNCEEQRTSVFLTLGGNCRQREEVSGGVWDVIFSRQLNWTSEDLDSFGKQLGKKIVANLGSQKIPSIKGRVILHPDVVGDLCAQILIPALSAKQIYAKASPFLDKVGESVFESQIDIYDNGRLPGGIGSGSFDGEGASNTGKTDLVDRGTLKGYLLNHYYASIFNTSNTANAYRPKYSDLPKVNSTNFIIEAHGTATLDDLIKETKEGVLIGGFSGNCNLEDGEFSGVCKKSFLIKNGELKHPLKDTMIAGNFYKFLSEGVFSLDSKKNYEFSFVNRTNMAVQTPSLVIDYDEFRTKK